MNVAYDKIKDRLLEYKKKNIIVPTPKMIKTKEQIEGIRTAGVINTAILDMVGSKIKAGMSTDEINTLVHNFTIEHGAIPAPLNYEGFPKSVCVSVNDAVCHGIPSKREILKNGDIVNVDVTTIYNGYFADASRMYIIGEAKPNAIKLVNVTKECLELALKAIKPWETRLGDIGEIISAHAHKNGYTVVREIGGHGVGLAMHEDPYVAHIGKKGTGMLLVPGMVFTIEPMINEGGRSIFQDSRNGWTIYTMDGKLSAQWEHTIVITEDGCEILTH
ncbi:MAG: type I methionyl aminopeptidase [Erysipelotrichaceae bacterium]|nr:type I methionyl aminopeptidase [Erysipelotrichaceae bacterium]MBR6515653.1 type I methionyl aminopeptidase [Bacilli bacterium]